MRIRGRSSRLWTVIALLSATGRRLALASIETPVSTDLTGIRGKSSTCRSSWSDVRVAAFNGSLDVSRVLIGILSVDRSRFKFMGASRTCSGMEGGLEIVSLRSCVSTDLSTIAVSAFSGDDMKSSSVTPTEASFCPNKLLASSRPGFSGVSSSFSRLSRVASLAFGNIFNIGQLLLRAHDIHANPPTCRWQVSELVSLSGAWKFRSLLSAARLSSSSMMLSLAAISTSPSAVASSTEVSTVVVSADCSLMIQKTSPLIFVRHPRHSLLTFAIHREQK